MSWLIARPPCLGSRPPARKGGLPCPPSTPLPGRRLGHKMDRNCSPAPRSAGFSAQSAGTISVWACAGAARASSAVAASRARQARVPGPCVRFPASQRRRALGRAPAPATMTPGSEEQSILRAVMTGKRRWQPAPSLAPTRPAAVVRRRVRPRRPGPGRRLQQGLDAFLTKPTGPACVLASTTPTWD